MSASCRFIYAASESCSDLRYATRFPAPDPFLWIQLGTEQFIVASPLEVGRAGRLVPEGLQVLSETAFRGRFGVGKDEPLTAPTMVTAVSRATGTDKWTVPSYTPLALARRLEANGLELAIEDTFFPERRTKSASEIDQVRHGIEIAEAGLARAVEILAAADVTQSGQLRWADEVLTAERLRGEVDAEIARLGGTAGHTITAPGKQGSDPHACGNGEILAGEPIVIDIFPRVNTTGYHGDLTRTVVKGAAPEIVTRAHAAVYEAQCRAKAAIRPGVPSPEVHQLAAQVLIEHGFETTLDGAQPCGFFHGLGHGLGLDVHEAPRLGMTVKDILEAGDVVTVEPGLYYPEWGGIRIEDVVAVTTAGYEDLTVAPVCLEID